MKKILAIFLAACMMISAVQPAFAETAEILEPEPAAETGMIIEEVKEARTVPSAGTEPAGSVSVLSETGGTGISLSYKDLLDLVLEGLKSAISSEIGDFTKDKIFKNIFPDAEAERFAKLVEMLETVLKNQEEMEKDLTRIESELQQEEYSQILNRYQTLSSSVGILTAFHELEQLDKELEEDPSRKAEIAEDRIHALTGGIGIQNPDNANAELDQFVYQMYKLITTEYFITVGKSNLTREDLLGVFYELCRRNPNYLFEHQAYDALDSFQSYVIGNYLLSAGIEMLSLDARIALCEEQGLKAGSVKQRRDDLRAEIEEVGKLLATRQVVHTDEYRYFWVPEYEVKFYTDAESRLMPREPLWTDPYREFDVGYQFEKTDGYPKYKVMESFWSPLWTHSAHPGSPALLSSDFEKLLEGSYKQTGTRISLYKLLFDKNLGNCTKTGSYAIDENTKYVVDRDDPEHSFHIQKKKTALYTYDFAFHCSVVGNVSEMKLTDWTIGNYVQSRRTIGIIPYEKYGECYFPRNLEENIFALIAKVEEKKEIRSPKLIDLCEKEEEPEEAENPVPAGSWKRTEDGSWQFLAPDGNPVTGWKELSWNGRTDWYYFDAQGVMQTGWILWNGDRYYLNPVSDGFRGAMLTGWQQIDGKWYYLRPESGGPKGALVTGPGKTPDGYEIGADGAWTGIDG